MKLYFYSSDLLKFVETKWSLATIATGGVLIGTIVFLGFMKMNKPFENVLESRSANALAIENDVLRRQLGLMLPRVSKLEIHAGRLNDRANTLRMLLPQHRIIGETGSSFTNATKGSRVLSLMAAAKSPRP